MKRLATVLAICAAGQAHALSCMAPTPENIFMWAHQAEEIYVPVYGTFDVAPVKRPDVGVNELPEGYETTGTFSGKFITRRGFGPELNTPVKVNVTCAAHWCGGTPGDGVMLAVLEKQDDGYVLHQNACPTSTFREPNKKQLNTFRK